MVVHLAPLQWIANLSKTYGCDPVLAVVVRPDRELGPEDITGEEYRPVYIREVPPSATPSPKKVRVKNQYLWFAPPFLTANKVFRVEDGKATLYVPPATGLYAFLTLPDVYGEQPKVAAYIPAINTAQLEATVKERDPVIMFTAVTNLKEALEGRITRSAVLLSFKRRKKVSAELVRFPVRGCTKAALYAVTVDPTKVAVRKDGSVHITLKDPVVDKFLAEDNQNQKNGHGKSWPLKFRTLKTRQPEGDIQYYVPKSLAVRIDPLSFLNAMRAILHAANIPAPEGTYYYSRSSTGSKQENLYSSVTRVLVFAARKAMEEDLVSWKLREFYEPAVACESVKTCFERTKYAVKSNRSDWLVKVTNTTFHTADPQVVLATRSGSAYVRLIADVRKNVEPTPLYMRSLEPLVELMEMMEREGYFKRKLGSTTGVFVKVYPYKTTFSATDELRAPPCRYSPWVMSDPLFFRDSELETNVLSFHILPWMWINSAPLDVMVEVAYRPVTGIFIVS